MGYTKCHGREYPKPAMRDRAKWASFSDIRSRGPVPGYGRLPTQQRPPTGQLETFILMRQLEVLSCKVRVLA